MAVSVASRSRCVSLGRSCGVSAWSVWVWRTTRATVPGRGVPGSQGYAQVATAATVVAGLSVARRHATPCRGHARGRAARVRAAGSAERAPPTCAGWSATAYAAVTPAAHAPPGGRRAPSRPATTHGARRGRARPRPPRTTTLPRSDCQSKRALAGDHQVGSGERGRRSPTASQHQRDAGPRRAPSSAAARSRGRRRRRRRARARADAARPRAGPGQAAHAGHDAREVAQRGSSRCASSARRRPSAGRRRRWRRCRPSSGLSTSVATTRSTPAQPVAGRVEPGDVVGRRRAAGPGRPRPRRAAGPAPRRRAGPRRRRWSPSRRARRRRVGPRRPAPRRPARRARTSSCAWGRARRRRAGAARHAWATLDVRGAPPPGVSRIVPGTGTPERVDGRPRGTVAAERLGEDVDEAGAAVGRAGSRSSSSRGAVARQPCGDRGRGLRRRSGCRRTCRGRSARARPRIAATAADRARGARSGERSRRARSWARARPAPAPLPPAGARPGHRPGHRARRRVPRRPAGAVRPRPGRARPAPPRPRSGDRVFVLGHHYQRDEVIEFADVTGDSFKLAREAAARPDAPIHRLLRRALHGRVRRHPHRATSRP